MFDQRGELPFLPFGNPIGPSTLLGMVSLSNHFVPASRGGVYIELSTNTAMSVKCLLRIVPTLTVFPLRFSFLQKGLQSLLDIVGFKQLVEIDLL